VIQQGMRLPLYGVAIGLILSIPAAQTLRGLVYGVSPRDPRVFALVALLLAVVALLATFIPARRATKVDPRISMAAE
jgi:putative ABC transport system permease protein